jgi:hypothetical protein
MSKMLAWPTYLIPYWCLASIVLHRSQVLLAIANELNVGVHSASRFGIVSQHRTLNNKL